MKRMSIIILLFSFALCLSSCSNKRSGFKYDDTITWNSSYADVIKAYGEPVQTLTMEGETNYSIVLYDNATVAGYKGFIRSFFFAEPSNNLSFIVLELHTDGISALLWAEPIFNALSEKYGEPSDFEQSDELFGGGSAYWRLNDTFIHLSYGCSSLSNIKEGIIQILYSPTKTQEEPTPTVFLKSTDGI